MKRSSYILIGAIVAGLSIFGWQVFLNQNNQPITLTDDESVIVQGADVYRSNCATCHGGELEGQENWRQRNIDGRLPAPPHDESGHTWHHDPEALFNITKFGVAAMIGDEAYESDMPVYEGILSDNEIIAVLSYIRSTWPLEIRQMYDQNQH